MRSLARRLFVVVLLFSIYHSLFTRPAYAQGEFETSYKVNYTVEQSGVTNVVQNITLTNKTTNYYADKFELKIGSTSVENVKAQDQTGPMETEVTVDNNQTVISVNFNQRVIGLEKSLSWSLTYSSSDFAAKSGQIWEVSIPKLAKAQDITTYEVSISTPLAFGKAAFSVPNPKTATVQGSRRIFSFDKEQLTQSGIAMSFGEKQVFTFTLNYHLENNSYTSQLQEITLPPDNNYQKVIYDKLDPQPIDVTVDDDGNFLAKYKLSAQSGIEIVAQGYVEVKSTPFRNLKPSLSSTDRERYTAAQKYWEIDNPLISQSSKELKTPRQIYDFVTETLSYSGERLNQPKIERKGAAAALASPADSVCMEFTDAFIALARSAGIPAREVEGYAFTQNERLRPLSLSIYTGDVLHAWPEYWDEKLGWVQVDPTWGSTSGGLDYFNKLDFNHITFVQRGISSTGPYPAGSFKKGQDSGKKGVFISFAQELPEAITNPKLSLATPTKIISGIPTKINILLVNDGSSSIFDQSLRLSSSKLKTFSKNMQAESPQSEIDTQVAILPPFARRDYSFTFISNRFLLDADDVLTASFGEAEIQKPIKIVPFYNLIFSTTFLLASVTSSVIVTAGLILYRKTKMSKV